MKRVLIFCLFLMLLPKTASAKTINNQETKMVDFHLEEGSSATEDVIISLSDGTEIRLDNSNGYEVKQMFMQDGVSVEGIKGGEFSGSIAEGEVRITVSQQQPTVHENLNPEYEEVQKSSMLVWLVVLVSVAGAASGSFYLRKKGL